MAEQTVAEQTDHSWRATLKRRLAVASGVFLLWSVAIEARLVYLQVFEHADLLERADEQQSRKIRLEPKRGDRPSDERLGRSAPHESRRAQDMRDAVRVDA